MSVNGKWGLVTGASSGIGQELVREAARLGNNLYLVARRLQLLLARMIMTL